MFEHFMNANLVPFVYYHIVENLWDMSMHPSQGTQILEISLYFK